MLDTLCPSPYTTVTAQQTSCDNETSNKRLNFGRHLIIMLRSGDVHSLLSVSNKF